MLIINNKALKVGNKWLNPVGSTPPTPPGPTFDEVTIGTQTWMASNLAIDDGKGDIFVQPSVVTNGASLGDQYFYNYTSASRIANSISGWHLPSVSEYTTLLNYLYGGNVTTNNIDQATLRKMMSTNAGWNSDSSPNNDSGFGMKPVGCVTTDNTYYQCGDGVSLADGGQVIHLLTSDTYSSPIGCYTLSNFVILDFNYSPMGYITNNPSINMGSVRLIKDT